MLIVDTHTHLDSFSDAEVSSILARARRVGVGAVISAGTTENTSRRAVELTSAFPDMFAGVGVHPMDLEGPIDDPAYARLHDMASSTGRVVVVSEIGLDFMEGMPDRAVQYQAFRRQIELARDLRLPIVFHSREAHSRNPARASRRASLRGRRHDALLPGRRPNGPRRPSTSAFSYPWPGRFSACPTCRKWPRHFPSST